MTILYDYQLFYAQKFGGASRVCAELAKHITASGDFVDIAVEYSNNEYLKDLNYINVKKHTAFDEFLGGIHFRGKYKLFQIAQNIGFIKNYAALNKNYSIEKLKKQQFDVFHPTFYDDYFLKYLGDKPFVLSLLDFTYEKFRNDELAKKEAYRKKILSHRAAHIIANSENTKKDAIELLDIPSEKISVIYLANSILTYKTNAINIPLLPKKYILYIGGRTDYKNFNRFFGAVIPLLKKDKDLHIICTGFPFTPQEKLNFTLKGVEKQITHIFATETMLSTLYQKAICFIFPSLYEGFGIPVLEAFANNCPVLLSTTSSLPEVGGDAALYFDPNSEEEIYSRIEEIISNDTLRQTLIKKGMLQLQKFSWEKTAQKTLDVYRKVVLNYVS